MPIDIWQYETDQAVLKALDTAALAGAFMRRWFRYVEDYRQTERRAMTAKNPLALWAAFARRWRLRFRA